MPMNATLSSAAGGGAGGGGTGGGSGRRRAGDDDENEAEENQLAQPGAFFAPAVVSMDAGALEAVETSAKRRQAERLLDVLKLKRDGGKKFEGKKPTGGLTNREKERSKNYLMKSKSSSVQGKLRASLKAKHRAVKKGLEHKSQGRLTKMRRRRN